MNYPGRDELASNYLHYFDNYESTFLNHIRTICACKSLVCTDIACDAYRGLFRTLLVKAPNIDEIKELCAKANFNSGVFYEALILSQADFARYLSKTTNSNFAYLHWFINACERCAKLTTNTFKASSAGEANIIATKHTASADIGIHADFIDIAKALISSGEQLEFLNLYNGVVVRSFSKSLRIDGQTLIAELDITQILAMKEESCAYIVKNNHIGSNMRANILWINTIAKTAALGKFEPQPYMHALKRAYPRLHPDRFTKVTLVHQDGRTATGKMFDLSQGGMGVVSTEDAGFKSGDMLTTDIELHNGEESLFLHLQFRLVVCISYQNAYRYCLQLDPSEQPDAALIEGFAKRREAETIAELNALIEQYRD